METETETGNPDWGFCVSLYEWTTSTLSVATAGSPIPAKG